MAPLIACAYGALLSQHGDDLPTDLTHLSDDDLHRVLADLCLAHEALSLDEGVQVLKQMNLSWTGGCAGRPAVAATREEMEQALHRVHADLCCLKQQLALVHPLAA